MTDPAAACAQTVRASRSNFALSFRFLPRRQRRAMDALYAFCRRTDDIADGSAPPEDKRRALDEWRGELTDRGRDPIIRAIVAAVADFDLDPIHLHRVIDGCAMDIDPPRFGDFEQLRDYCSLVAGAVGHLCLGIWGVHGDRADAFAEDLGLAVQITNILRDVGADAATARVYLPLDLLARHGVGEEDVLARRQSPALTAAMTDLAAEARAAYARADIRAFRRVDRRRLWPARIIARIYRRLLREVEAQGFPLTRRVHVGKSHKVLAVVSVLAGRLLPW